MALPIKSFFPLCFLLCFLFSCNNKAQTGTHGEGNHQYTNELINESSPYLLQHAHNPVNWYPWGDKALAKAKAENKPIIISVGYAACHWCHVMEHESFEDTAVAKIMNDNFVAIKVDREERPDVDQIYMNAAYIVNNRGGWPLNALALPNGKPFFAGTYYPKKDWLELLVFFNNTYKNEPDKLKDQAKQITQGIKSIEMVPKQPEKPAFTKADLDTIFNNWKDIIDYKLGGKKTKSMHSPKFPMPNNYQALLRYHHFTGNQKALEAVTVTLDNMAIGGIYDHLGGGFARYSTDAKWLAPHFEKMMYDNGQIVSLYSEAYQLTKNPLYKTRVYETLEWVKREMTSPEGGFYSSLDADSDGEEGKFYVWQKAEIDELLGDDAKLFCKYYNVSEKGNWEHKNILHTQQSDAEFAKANDLSVAELREKIDAGKQILFKKRESRIRPGLDDKVLTGWNALMLKGYVDAYRVFGEEEYLEAAVKNAQFIVDKCMQSDNRLNRNFKDGKSVINAFLDDYSLTAEAFIALYQATFDEQWLYKAEGLVEYALAHFYDEESGMFFYTSDVDDPLIARKMEVSDNVIPASNSSMAKTLYLLGHYFYKDDYIQKSKQMLTNVTDNVYQNGAFYSNWAWLMVHFANEPYDVAIVGEDAALKRAEFDLEFLPNVLFLGGKTAGTLKLLENKLIPNQTTIYVCQQKVCKFPVTEVEKALELMK